MDLRIISLSEDKTKELYGSEDCQKILSIYEDYYQKIGFNLPWVGYFVLRKNQIVGCCGFTGQPKTAPESNASTRILHNLGFRFSGIVKDEEIGDAWLWILDTGKANGFDHL